MLTEGIEAELLEKAIAAEKIYKWTEPAKLHEEIAKLYRESGKIDKTTEFYKKAADNYGEAVSTAENSEELRNSIF